ncbi:MAG: hypothetical protein NXI24_08780 [bacterium]|nr:hypothetical protein [bacterium]
MISGTSESSDARLQADLDALSPRARELFDAHLKFESAALGITGDDGRDDRRKELEYLYDWLAGRPISDFANPTESFAWIKRRFLDQTPGPGSVAIVDAVAQALHSALAARQENADALISEQAFALMVKDLSQDVDLRDTIVDGMVHNAVFSLVISEILYHGIADFMADSKLTNSIPGAQSLFKLGQNLLNQTAPGLKDGFEKSIKEFIKNNAGQIIKNSEAAVKKSLSPAVIQQAAEQFHAELSETPINTLTRYVAPEKLPAYREAAEHFGEKVRTSPITADLIAAGLEAFFEELRNHKAADLLIELGVDRETFVTEGLEFLSAAPTRQYAENLLKRRLLAFYNSDEARELVK